MYGMTESKRCTWLPPEQLARRPDSVDIAIRGPRCGWPTTRAVGAARHDRRAGGARQPYAGYWRNEEATAKTLRPGRYPWEKVLHTGDLFRMDEEGFLYFVGRKDDILKTRGEKVSPKEVENVLYALPGVREAALVGVPDPVMGHALKAIVVRDGDAPDARAILAHCRAHLEEFMVRARWSSATRCQDQHREDPPQRAPGRARGALPEEDERRPDGQVPAPAIRRVAPASAMRRRISSRQAMARSASSGSDRRRIMGEWPSGGRGAVPSTTSRQDRRIHEGP